MAARICAARSSLSSEPSPKRRFGSGEDRAIIKFPRPASFAAAISKDTSCLEEEVKQMSAYSFSELGVYIKGCEPAKLRELVIYTAHHTTALFHRIFKIVDQLKKEQQIAVYEQVGCVIPTMQQKELLAWAEYAMSTATSPDLALVVPLFNISQLLFLTQNTEARLLEGMIPHIKTEHLHSIFDALLDTRSIQKAFYALTGAQKKEIAYTMESGLLFSETTYLSKVQIAVAVATPALNKLVLDESRIHKLSQPRLLVCLALGPPDTLITLIDHLNIHTLSRLMPRLSQAHVELVYSRKETLADLALLVPQTPFDKIAQCLNCIPYVQFEALVRTMSDEQLCAVAAVVDEGGICPISKFCYQELFKHRNRFVLNSLCLISFSEATTLSAYIEETDVPFSALVIPLDRVALIFAMGYQQLRVKILKHIRYLAIDQLEAIAPLLNSDELSEALHHLNEDGCIALTSHYISHLPFSPETDLFLKERLRMATASVGYMREDISDFKRDIEEIQKEMSALESPGDLPKEAQSKKIEEIKQQLALLRKKGSEFMKKVHKKLGAIALLLRSVPCTLDPKLIEEILQLTPIPGEIHSLYLPIISALSTASSFEMIDPSRPNLQGRLEAVQA